MEKRVILNRMPGDWEDFKSSAQCDFWRQLETFPQQPFNTRTSWICTIGLRDCDIHLWIPDFHFGELCNFTHVNSRIRKYLKNLFDFIHTYVSSQLHLGRFKSQFAHINGTGQRQGFREQTVYYENV